MNETDVDNLMLDNNIDRTSIELLPLSNRKKNNNDMSSIESSVTAKHFCNFNADFSHFMFVVYN